MQYEQMNRERERGVKREKESSRKRERESSRKRERDVFLGIIDSSYRSVPVPMFP